MTGAELKAHRKAAGLSQARLAELAGVTRDTVQYWEAKAQVKVRWGAPRRFCEVLELRDKLPNYAQARGWGLTRRRLWMAKLDEQVELKLAEARARDAVRAARHRVICGALTRKGTACRLMSEPGRTRCKFHGGKSTGPRTAEGRARIAEAQRRRWAGWRADRTGERGVAASCAAPRWRPS